MDLYLFAQPPGPGLCAGVWCRCDSRCRAGPLEKMGPPGPMSRHEFKKKKRKEKEFTPNTLSEPEEQGRDLSVEEISGSAPPHAVTVVQRPRPKNNKKWEYVKEAQDEAVGGGKPPHAPACPVSQCPRPRFWPRCTTRQSAICPKGRAPILYWPPPGPPPKVEGTIWPGPPAPCSWCQNVDDVAAWRCPPDTPGCHNPPRPPSAWTKHQMETSFFPQTSAPFSDIQGPDIRDICLCYHSTRQAAVKGPKQLVDVILVVGPTTVFFPFEPAAGNRHEFGVGGECIWISDGGKRMESALASRMPSAVPAAPALRRAPESAGWRRLSRALKAHRTEVTRIVLRAASKIIEKFFRLRLS